MDKKIFISFLGTNKYIPCNYFFGDNKVKNVEFVQEALIKIFFEPFTNDSTLIFFLTPKAKEINWGKLKSRLENYPEKSIKAVDIPDGKTEDEIWNIFEKVYENIPEESSIIFDITHAFRSIPMLAISLLNYAKVLKNIKVAGIYYGAVETLGDRKTIEKMSLEERNAPIFNLTQFDELIEWSNGAYEFSKYGITNKLNELILNRIKPILAKTKGQDIIARRLRDISEELEKIAESLTTVRGKEIYQNLKFSEIKNYLTKIEENVRIKPYKPLINKIKKKIENFETNNIKNLFYAAKFCYEHNLIQQSITILLEATITYFCKKFDFDFKDRNKRALISQLFKIKLDNVREDNWKSPASDNVELTKSLLVNINIDFAKNYKNLSQLRNDINHGGFLENSAHYSKFRKDFKKYYEAIMKYLFD